MTVESSPQFLPTALGARRARSVYVARFARYLLWNAAIALLLAPLIGVSIVASIASDLASGELQAWALAVGLLIPLGAISVVGALLASKLSGAWRQPRTTSSPRPVDGDRPHASSHRALAERSSNGWVEQDFDALGLPSPQTPSETRSTFEVLQHRYAHSSSVLERVLMLRVLGHLNVWSGALDSAQQAYMEALELSAAVNQLHDQGFTLVLLGTVEIHAGRWDEAARRFDSAIRAFREVGDFESSDEASRLRNAAIQHRYASSRFI